MAVLQFSGIADFVTATQRMFKKTKLVDLMSSLQRHPGVKQLMRKNRVSIKSGRACEWEFQNGTNGSTRFLGLYASPTVNVIDSLGSLTLDWIHVNSNCGFDQHEADMNSDPARIVDLIKARHRAMYADWVETMETAFWTCPASTNTSDPKGVPYHIVKNNTTGFNGGHASGYSDWAGKSRTTYTRLKNYTAQYTNISKADLVDKMREGAMLIEFHPLVEDMPLINAGKEIGIYTCRDVALPFGSLLEAQNDNLGNDLASKDGVTTFHRTSVEWVPKLDSDTTDPIYFMHWPSWEMQVLKNWWMNELVVKGPGDQPRVVNIHLDTSLQIVCFDPRRNAVFAKDV